MITTCSFSNSQVSRGFGAHLGRDPPIHALEKDQHAAPTASSNEVPQSVRGAPEGLRGAIRRQQNKLVSERQTLSSSLKCVLRYLQSGSVFPPTTCGLFVDWKVPNALCISVWTFEHSLRAEVGKRESTSLAKFDLALTYSERETKKWRKGFLSWRKP